VSLEARFWPKVDMTGDCWLWTASLDCNGYGKIGAGGDRGRTLCAHRVAWELVRGAIPDGLEIDHICRMRTCVRPDHLRLTSRKQNNEHRVQEHALPRGVRLHHTGKFHARAKHNRREVNGGLFLTVDEAAEAARQLRNRLFTHNDADRLVSR
jgi:hypothetical protein